MNVVQIKKNYGNEVVFDNFTYKFPGTGYILLYGKSGCGKTTLLNILSGMTNFDEGFVEHNGELFSKKIECNFEDMEIAYITQETIFIDYLTINDNLLLCSNNESEIDNLLNEFGIFEKKYSYPNELSVGQKQRVAIIQAIITNKKIILMDEPTAALDNDNKEKIFSIINSLKKDRLIICSSHDQYAKKYADDVIDFSLKSQYVDNKDYVVDNNDRFVDLLRGIRRNNRKTNIFHFMRKKKFYNSEKKTKIRLGIIFVLVILMSFIGSTPKTKIESSMEYFYNIRQFYVSCDINDKSIQKIFCSDGVSDVALMYNLSVPCSRSLEQYKDLADGTVIKSDDYNMTALTLPYDKNNFELIDRIIYGEYFNNVNQVILPYDYAIQYGEPQEMVGKTIDIELYDQVHSFEVCGVLDRLNKAEEQYMNACGIYPSNLSEDIILNSEFMKRFEDDEHFSMFGTRTYTVYFDSYKDMKKCYETLLNDNNNFVVNYGRISIDMEFMFYRMTELIYPLISVVLLMAMVFYFQSKRTEMIYTRHIYSVYQYYGYNVKDIKKGYILVNIIEVMKVFFISLSCTIPIVLAGNYFNGVYKTIPFRLFTLNIGFLAIIMIGTFLVAIVCSILLIRYITKTKWYDIFVEQRDLI